jgi:hypothetical protein
MLAFFSLAAATLVAAVSAPATPAPSARCLDSFLSVGQPIARPLDVAQSKVSDAKPDYVIRTDILVAPKLPNTPMVGFLYITHERSAFFSTRQRASIDPTVHQIIREIYAASTMATAAQLQALLDHQNGNAIVYLPRALKLLRSLDLKAARCVVLQKGAKVP